MIGNCDGMYICVLASLYIAIAICFINGFITKFKNTKKEKQDLLEMIKEILAVIVIIGIMFYLEMRGISFVSVVYAVPCLILEGVVGPFIRIPAARIIMITGVVIILGYYIYYNYIRKDIIKYKNDEKVNNDEEKKEN